MVSFFLKVLLTVHIAGMVTSVAGLYSRYAVFKRFMTLIQNFRQMGHPEMEPLLSIHAFRGSEKIFWIGIGMSLLSGASMMHLAYSAFMSQFWFISKIVTIVAIVILFIYTRRSEKQLRVQFGFSDDRINASAIIRKIYVAYYAQLALFVIIFILAVFRFN